MVVDTFCYSGEADILEIRFNILNDYVDQFVIIESDTTFSGLPKPLYWAERGDRFEEFQGKVKYHVVNNYGEDKDIMALMENNPLTPPNLEHYRRAFYQKESIKRALTHLKDDDYVFYGDVDEIPNPYAIDAVDDKTYKLRQIAYSYYLNNRSPEDWRGTIVTKYKNIKEGSLNEMRADQSRILNGGGWHFTNMGGLEAVLKKLEWYDHQEANIPWVKDGLKERMDNNIDFLGRSYQFWVDESELPAYILANKEKYHHLWK